MNTHTLNLCVGITATQQSNTLYWYNGKESDERGYGMKPNFSVAKDAVRLRLWTSDHQELWVFVHCVQCQWHITEPISGMLAYKGALEVTREATIRMAQNFILTKSLDEITALILKGIILFTPPPHKSEEYRTVLYPTPAYELSGEPEPYMGSSYEYIVDTKTIPVASQPTITYSR
jgi:hypothetical protein